jgi:hypothetical protein
VQQDPARRRHYADFYDPDRLERAVADPRPLCMVVGNCQAEAMRLLLDGPVTSLRIPPVHEMTASDLGALHRILARVDVLVTQPIREGYRGLGLGSAQLAARCRPDTAVVTVPVLRDTGLFPDHAIVRDPTGRVGDPPLAPYHHLSLLARAAGLRLDPLDVDSVRSDAALSVEQLRRRERAHHTVPASDLLEQRTAASFHTLNHPGNPVLLGVARRVRAALGLTEEIADPGRELLGAVLAPLEPVVLEALDLTGPPRLGWLVDGRALTAEEVADSHLQWYRENPAVVEHGLERHRDRLALRGLRG